MLSQCPNCSGLLVTSAKKCQECELEVRFPFKDNPLFLLPEEDQDFLLQFILCSGNFKALGERVDLTYPTLRARLDRILAKLETQIPAEDRAQQILDAVDQGTLSPTDAISQLKQVTRKGETAK